MTPRRPHRPALAPTTPTSGLGDNTTLLAAILALVAIAVVALILVRRRRTRHHHDGGGVTERADARAPLIDSEGRRPALAAAI